MVFTVRNTDSRKTRSGDFDTNVSRTFQRITEYTGIFTALIREPHGITEMMNQPLPDEGFQLKINDESTHNMLLMYANILIFKHLRNIIKLNNDKWSIISFLFTKVQYFNNGHPFPLISISYITMVLHKKNVTM